MAIGGIVGIVGSVIGVVQGIFGALSSKKQLDAYKAEISEYDRLVTEYQQGIYTTYSILGYKTSVFDLSKKLGFSFVGGECFYLNESMTILKPNVLLDFYRVSASIPSPILGYDLNNLPAGVIKSNGHYFSRLGFYRDFVRWANAELKKTSVTDLGDVYINGRVKHFSFVGVDRLAADFDLNVRNAIRSLSDKPDWYFVSQNCLQLVFTPTAKIMAPMTFYDIDGNFYIIHSDGNAELLLGWDQKPPIVGEIDFKDHRSSFSGLSIRNWEDAQLVLEAEKKAKDIEQLQKQADESVSIEKSSKNDQQNPILLRILTAILVLLGVYWLYKKIKK